MGDFNADGRPDIVLLSYGARQSRAAVYYHTGEPGAPYRLPAQATLALEGAPPPATGARSCETRRQLPTGTETV